MNQFKFRAKYYSFTSAHLYATSCYKENNFYLTKYWKKILKRLKNLG